MTQIKEIDNEVDNEPPLDHDILEYMEYNTHEVF